MDNKELMALLEAPFPEMDIEWRVQSSGAKSSGEPWARVIAYTTARAVAERLDNVFGVEGWRVEYQPLSFEHQAEMFQTKELINHHVSGFMCGISVMIDGGSWVTKWDGADCSDTEPFKGGISHAFKRAAVAWGIGRYLYKLDSDYATFSDNGPYSVKINGNWYKWIPPQLPSWALPKNSYQAAVAMATPPAPAQQSTQDLLVEPPQPTKGDIVFSLLKKLETIKVPAQWLLEFSINTKRVPETAKNLTDLSIDVLQKMEKNIAWIKTEFDKQSKGSHVAPQAPIPQGFQDDIPFDDPREAQQNAPQQQAQKLTLENVALRPLFTGNTKVIADWREVKAHFGKNKDVALGIIHNNKGRDGKSWVDWAYDNWQVKPFNGKIQDKDLTLDAGLVAFGNATQTPYNPPQQA